MVIDLNKINEIGKNFEYKISQMSLQMKIMQEKMRKDSEEALNSAFKEFFEIVPEIAAITWTQYTPYFNDGDTCVFRVDDFWFVPDFMMQEWKEDGGGYAEEYSIILYGDDPYYCYIGMEGVELPSSERMKHISETCKVVEKMLYSIPSEVYQNLFGDHVCVAVTKNGIDVEEYEHE